MKNLILPEMDGLAAHTLGDTAGSWGWQEIPPEAALTLI